LEASHSLSVRSYDASLDPSRIAELINSSRASSCEDRAEVTADQVRAFIAESWDDFDIRTDVHLFFCDDRLVGYERTKRETWGNGARAYHAMLFLHPDWRRKEILTETLMHLRQYQLDYATRYDGEADPFIAIMPQPADPPILAALRAAGFEPCRVFLSMERDLTRPVVPETLPAGLTQRPLDALTYRAIYDFDRRIMRDGWGVEAPNERHFKWWAEEAFQDPELWRVAWDRDRIVGTAAGAVRGTWNPSLGGERAEIRFVRVDPPWRRRGIARALILECLSALWQRGIRIVELSVDGENEATAGALYRRLGFEVTARRVAYRYDLALRR